MYETVKVVNGYAVERMIGFRGSYWVTIWKRGDFAKKYWFRPAKAAAQFCEKLPRK